METCPRCKKLFHYVEGVTGRDANGDVIQSLCNDCAERLIGIWLEENDDETKPSIE